MEKFLVFLFILSLYPGQCWNIQLSSNSYAVPFGNSHITVFDDSNGNFYANPLACLKPESANATQKFLSGRIELDFKIVLWTYEARETVYHYIKANVNSSVVEDRIGLLPMDRIRLFLRPRLDYYEIPDNFRLNNHFPTEVTFSIRCQNMTICQKLQQEMRTNPSHFSSLEFQYLFSQDQEMQNENGGPRTNLTIHRVKVQSHCGPQNQSTTLTPELVQSRMEERLQETLESLKNDSESNMEILNATMTELNKEVIAELRNIEKLLDSSSKSPVSNRSLISIPTMPEYCYAPRRLCHTQHYLYSDLNDLNHCLGRCRDSARCHAFNYSENQQVCWLFTSICDSNSLKSGGREFAHYVRMTKISEGEMRGLYETNIGAPGREMLLEGDPCKILGVEFRSLPHDVMNEYLAQASA